MFPPIHDHSRSRSVLRSVQERSSTHNHHRLPKISKWSLTDPNRRNVRSSSSSRPRRDLRRSIQNGPRSRRSTTAPKIGGGGGGQQSAPAAADDGTYDVLDRRKSVPNRFRYAPAPASAFDNDDNNKKVTTTTSRMLTLAEREALNEGVVRECRFIKSVLDDRILSRKYRLGETVGQGNFSVVVKCYERRRDGGGPKALKIVSIEDLNDHYYYYVENEVALLCRFDHRNIVKLHEAHKTPYEYYLVMEYVENGDLFDAVKRAGTLDEPSTASVVRDVASALGYIHARAIVHRDVKPENLLLTDDMRVKLGDFGLACRVEGPLYRVCGTPTYVAPEILAETTGYGLQVDCWSLGVITYILLCGYAPFRCGDRSQLFRAIRQGRFEFDEHAWKGISQGAKRLISSLLVISPLKRANAWRVLRSDWLKKAAANAVKSSADSRKRADRTA